MISYQHIMVGTLVRLPRSTGRKGDDVKSVWPLRLGLHTYYNAQHNVTRYCEVEGIMKNWAQFGL